MRADVGMDAFSSKHTVCNSAGVCSINFFFFFWPLPAFWALPGIHVGSLPSARSGLAENVATCLNLLLPCRIYLRRIGLKLITKYMFYYKATVASDEQTVSKYRASFPPAPLRPLCDQHRQHPIHRSVALFFASGSGGGACVVLLQKQAQHFADGMKTKEFLLSCLYKVMLGWYSTM